jgi:DUF1016 N-terminal domain
MKKRAKTQLLDTAYAALLSDVMSLLDAARRTAGRTVNHIITSAYWEIGRRIVEHEQKGSRRAEYGEQLMRQLAKDLTERFGRGFSQSNVFQMRQFFLAHRGKFQTMSGKSRTAPLFPLSWSHYVRLLSVKDDGACQFYEQEALRGGWSVRQLDRQIATLFYERASRSKTKLAG